MILACVEQVFFPQIQELYMSTVYSGILLICDYQYITKYMQLTCHSNMQKISHKRPKNIRPISKISF